MDKQGAVENFNPGRGQSNDRVNLLAVHDSPNLSFVAQQKEPTHGTIDFADHGDIYKTSDAASTKQAAPIEAKPGVSFAFKESANNWWNTLPESVQKMVASGHIKVILADNAMQVMPNADKIQARGHQAGETYAMQPGFYYPQQHALVLVEHHQLTPAAQATKAQNERAHVATFDTGVDKAIAWHELGHALDYQSMGLLSHSAAFSAAYKSDCKTFSNDRRIDDHYYLQANPLAAQEEVLAQMFWLSHKSNQISDDQLFIGHFPQVEKLMQQKGLI